MATKEKGKEALGAPLPSEQREMEEEARIAGLAAERASQRSTDALAEDASVHERMAAILGRLPSIGKTTENTQQHFMYRSHDAVLNALNPLLADYRVVVIPHKVLERLTDQRPTRSGGVMYEVNLLVQYRFYGPKGDYVEAEAWGEGTDSGDKATNKAMTMAFKNVLAQSFSVSTQDTVDSDSTTDEATMGRASMQVHRQDEDVLRAKVPATWSDALRRFDALTANGNAAAWLEEIIEKRWNVTTLGALSAEDRKVVSTGFFSALMFLEDTYGDQLAFTDGSRAVIQAAFATKFDGIALDGPAWALDSKEAEAGRPQQADLAAAPAKESAPPPEPEAAAAT